MSPISPFPRPEAPLYAIGDLHGCAQHLERMIDAIDADRTARGNENAAVVFLGDYVDRGEDSRGVLLRLFEAAHAAQAAPDGLTCLMGNHEKMFLDFLDSPDTRGARWLRYGGLQTLASFQVGGLTDRASPGQLIDAAERLRAVLPEGLEAWLRGLPLWWRSGDVVCVHAAMDPAVPPEMQEPRDMLWGNALFYRYVRPDGLWMVHGHDVVDAPTVTERRVACDTGAYFSGNLTAAAIFPDEEVRFLNV